MKSIAAVLALALGASAYPRSCAEYRDTFPLEVDGEKTIELVTALGPVNVTLYLHNMATVCDEYLTLPNAGAQNCGRYVRSGRTVETCFQRIRINPRTLKVNIGDTTWSTTTGIVANFNETFPISRRVVGEVFYASAVDCDFGTEAHAQASISFGNLPFGVSITQAFSDVGVSPFGVAPVFNDARTEGVITGGGNCGGQMPSPPLEDKLPVTYRFKGNLKGVNDNSFRLQLYYRVATPSPTPVPVVTPAPSPNPTTEPTPLPPGSTFPPIITSCQQARDTLSLPSGEYMTSYEGSPTVYCDLDGAEAKTYITLPNAAVAQYVSATGPVRTTTFSKVRARQVSGVTWEIDNADYAFATATGAATVQHCSSTLTLVENVHFGTAGSCSNQPNAAASIDFTGTSFALNENVVVGGFPSSQGFSDVRGAYPDNTFLLAQKLGDATGQTTVAILGGGAASWTSTASTVPQQQLGSDVFPFNSFAADFTSVTSIRVV